MSFTDTSQKLAADFLQSVLVIDDRAYNGVGGDAKGTSTDLTPPRSRPSSLADSEVEADTGGDEVRKSESVETPPEDDAEDDELHDLDAGEITRGFLEHHIFCSVLSPTRDELSDLPSLFEQVKPIAARTDIAVFDWVLNPGGDGEGGEATELISRIIEDDRGSENRDRIRLIAIYTGTKDLAGIADSIEASLKASTKNQGIVREGDFTLTMGGTRIAVYAKYDTFTEDTPDLFARQKSVRELPPTLIKEFSRMTRGLVSNAAIRSLTVLRENTFQLLSTFDSKLDGPYLEHRVMLPSPEDAEEYLVRLITSEIGSLLDATEVRSTVDFHALRDWVRHFHSTGEIDISHVFQNDSIEVRDIFQLLEVGASRKNELSNNLKPFGSGSKILKKGIDEAFCRQDLDAGKASAAFSELTLLEGRYESEKPPFLSLGAILWDCEEGYWLCLQPRCDSVRLYGPRDFPMLPMQAVEKGKKRHLVFSYRDEILRLKINLSPYALEMMEFAPNVTERLVRAERDVEGVAYYRSTSGEEYVWLANLKPEQAQRFVQRYTNRFSRIGLDESERIRRRSP